MTFIGKAKFYFKAMLGLSLNTNCVKETYMLSTVQNTQSFNLYQIIAND